jgi:tRNA U34 5-methylaminomethyl-2-thiouridine-forming methyltransferase MnmC
MHSAIGAEREAQELYLAQASLADRALRCPAGPLVLWDVGLGIAANSWLAIEAWLGAGGSRGLHVVSFEDRPDALELALARAADFPWLQRGGDAARRLLSGGDWVSSSGRARWSLVRGDFRSGLDRAPAPDLVFHDFYAPRSCPELWSLSLFERMRARAAPDCLLVTYASSTPVRTALLCSGWSVARGSGTALKRESTLACAGPGMLGNALGPEWLEKWERSSGWSPPGCTATREQVRDRLRAQLPASG